jgi:flagellar hook-associated protein 1
MGLSSALATAMSGLRANQAALSIVSSNIANASDAGYITETSTRSEVATGGYRRERSGHRRQPPARSPSSRISCGPKPPAAPMPTRLRIFWASCRDVYGTPGGTGTLETAFDNFTTAIAGAVDELGQSDRAGHGVVGGASAGAATQYNHAGHPVAAHQRGAGHRHLRDRGQHGYDPDRVAQHPVAGTKRRPIRPPRRWMDQRDAAINQLSQV